MSTLAALLQSRKWWTGTITIAAVAAATLLRSLGKIPADALLPTIMGICTIGTTVIASIAWEDVSAKKAKGPAPIVAGTVNVLSKPPVSETKDPGNDAPSS